MVVDFSKLELNKLIPIYIQIIRHVKMEILAGNAQDGFEMPSRRLLSTLLSVNPNTVQKAYKQMEEEGIIISYPGSKSLVVVNEENIIKIRQELISDEVLSFIRSAKTMGFTLDQAKSVLDKYWDYEG
ncbi:MAG: GntR family transcriptional regulator [Clostridiales bacterium]|jgi:GntR family transcriptional regulator|nr:GntR family transcriptional regulator [Clostridiales bacterium]